MTSIRVPVQPQILDWAETRSLQDGESLRAHFPKLDDWKEGAVQPTLKQLEDFAAFTHTPFGFLMLAEPPIERLPIPDFRTMPSERYIRPSPDLLETIYICQERQDWYRDFMREIDEHPLQFVGKETIRSDVKSVADEIRKTIGLDIAERRGYPTWQEALRSFIAHADDAGILVMCSGVVGNNNHRPLDPQEFRGFALADPLAPLIFINGSDSKSAQMFTLAHELAHIWIGSTALSDVPIRSDPQNETELWCNKVAAEILVPESVFRDVYNVSASRDEEFPRMSRMFKVSSLVILRRMLDLGYLSSGEYWDLYHREEDRLRTMPKSSGGNFFLTQAARASKRFTRALIVSTLEGHTLHRDAFRYLGLTKIDTFNKLGQSLGVI